MKEIVGRRRIEMGRWVAICVGTVATIILVVLLLNGFIKYRHEMDSVRIVGMDCAKIMAIRTRIGDRSVVVLYPTRNDGHTYTIENIYDPNYKFVPGKSVGYLLYSNGGREVVADSICN